MSCLPGCTSVSCLPGCASVSCLPECTSVSCLPECTSVPCLPEWTSVPHLPGCTSLSYFPGCASVPCLSECTSVSCLPGCVSASCLPECASVSPCIIAQCAFVILWISFLHTQFLASQRAEVCSSHPGRVPSALAIGRILVLVVVGLSLFSWVPAENDFWFLELIPCYIIPVDRGSLLE